MDIQEARELAAQRYGTRMGYTTREELEFCRFFVERTTTGNLMVIHELVRDIGRTIRADLPAPLRRLLGA